MAKNLPQPIRRTTQILACSWLSDSGEEAKKKAREKLAGRGKGKRKRESPRSPQFAPILFSCLRFLNSADPTISEPGTGYPDPGSDASSVWNFCAPLSTTTTQTLFQEVASRNVGSFLRLDKFWLTIKKLFPIKLAKDPGYSLGKWIKSLG